MLSTDRQTDKQTNQRYQKHTLLFQGGNAKEVKIKYLLQRYMKHIAGQ